MSFLPRLALSVLLLLTAWLAGVGCAGHPASQTLAYKLDAAQQLTEVRNGSLTGTLLEAYLYDNAGQLTQACKGSGVSRPSDTSCTGNQITQYAFDPFDRLIQIAGTTTARYAYDDQGRRIQKTEAGQTTHYRYDGANLWSESPSPTATPSALYVQAGTDRPLARLTGPTQLPTAQAAYYHADGLGSVLATTNTSKTLTATQRFDALGLKLAGTGTVPTYGYTGREPDASGLIYYRARYYDPNLGRFTQRDPLGYTDGLNPYAYVHDNPINLTDPNGLLAQQVSQAWESGKTYFASGQFADTVGETVDAFGAAAQGNPLLGLSAAPAVGIAEGIQSGSVGRIAFEVGTSDIPGAKAGISLGGTIVGSILRQAGNAADVAKGLPPIKPGSANGPTAGQRFPESVKDAAKAENPTATCVYCRIDGTATQVDHAISRARGGNATLDNAQLACPHCNASKGAGEFPKTPSAGYRGPWPPEYW